MYADVERVRFDSAKQIVRLIHQQGRVFLPSELNEQTDIILHYLRMLVTDLVGHGATGTKADGTTPADDFKLVQDGKTLIVTKGHYWVDGYLLELPADQAVDVPN